MTCMVLQSIEYETKCYYLHVDGSFAIFSTKSQYPGWVWISTMHVSTYTVRAKWHIMEPGVGSENIVYRVAISRTKTLESYKILMCYCVDCKISGRMTLGKMWDTVFQYTQIQYISIVLINWVLQGKHSIRIVLFPLWVCIKKWAKTWNLLIFLLMFYKGMEKISTLPWVRKYL